jgi:hypothetical protein
VRRALANRYVVVLGAIALAVVAWNVYVVAHRDGRIAGLVVGPDGRPVADATVTLRERTLTTLEPRATARTDEHGEFVFTGQQVHHFALDAHKDGVGAAPRATFRLYFRGQHFVLPASLRLAG